MNAAQANALSLPAILAKLGYQPQKQRRRDHLYLSPLRQERTPSFHVNIADNIWYDFGEGRGGDVVDFACAWLESRSLGHSVQEALRFLQDMYGFAVPQEVFKARASAKRAPEAKTDDDCPALSIITTHSLRHPSLLRYLTDDRMIPLDLARKYLVEVEVHNRNTGKTFHAIAMKNADGGYELRTREFQVTAGHKDVTVLRGSTLPAAEVHVFEGFMDLLSALADQELDAFPGDMIVLHSLACLSKALPYIENYEHYTRLFSWLDNDQAGEKATQFLQRVAGRQAHLDFCAMNRTYTPFKDVNECRMVRLKLPLLR